MYSSTRIRRSALLAATAVMMSSVVGCSTATDDAETIAPPETGIDTTIAVTDAGSETTVAPEVAETELPPPTSSDTEVAIEVAQSSESSSESGLTADEIAGLLWMREEEQLAHDVYAALHEVWGLRIFENIGDSESTHVESVIRVLDRFDIDDPAAGNDPGTFTDPRIQDLYDRLVADGAGSLEDALAVGAFIEELDIDDLRIQVAATDVAALTDLYGELERGSRNHLRAFTSQLGLREVDYEPTRLEPADFDDIVSSPIERGRDA